MRLSSLLCVIVGLGVGCGPTDDSEDSSTTTMDASTSGAEETGTDDAAEASGGEETSAEETSSGETTSAEETGNDDSCTVDHACGTFSICEGDSPIPDAPDDADVVAACEALCGAQAPCAEACLDTCTQRACSVCPGTIAPFTQCLVDEGAACTCTDGAIDCEVPEACTNLSDQQSQCGG